MLESDVAFHAHSDGRSRRSRWHSLAAHLTGTAELAATFATPFGGQRLAHLAGLLHDVGKYSLRFQERLAGSPERVDHSTAGAYLLTRGELTPESGADLLLAGLAAYAIAGHHAGLADWDLTANGSTGGELRDRLDAFDLELLHPAWREELSVEATELTPPGLQRPGGSTDQFATAMLCRMIFSCLVDADFKDTERYFAEVEGRTVDREWPDLQSRLPELRARLEHRMSSLQSSASGIADGDVQRLRTHVHRSVRDRATDSPGFFTLTVPTGGGKTLTSLGFALDHAAHHGHRRVIYAIPFTSIIDQTAVQFREILGEDCVLEHHSALQDGFAPGSDRTQGRSKLDLAMEDWAAPIVVTTNVQLFESLFAARPSRCRKLHNIAGSVIVLDEAQALPLHLLAPCVQAMRELVAHYGCTIVLCTATQPALDASHFEGLPDALKRIGLPLSGRELAPDPAALAAALQRVTLRVEGETNDTTLIGELGSLPQGMVIVNSRAHALQLFELAEAAGLTDVVHLSTRQHAEDRRRILSAVRKRLAEGRSCRLIATSLVEAGVDIDFPRLWRAETGLEQIAQAAGRCNREGRRTAEESIVSIFRSPDHAPPTELRRAATDFARVRERFEDNELLSPDAITAYFREVYWRTSDGTDRESILDLFSFHGSRFQGQFRTAAARFRMIESGMTPVIVPDMEGRTSAALDALERGYKSAGSVSRELQTRLVQVPPRSRDELVRAGAIQFVADERFGDQFAVLVQPRLYDSSKGLLWEQADQFDGIA